MMCCAIAGLVMATLVAWRSLARRLMARLPLVRWAFVALAAGLFLVGGAALAADQLGRSRASPADLAAVLMLHICGEHPAPSAS